MTDEEALTEILGEQPLGTYVIMTLKTQTKFGFHRNSVCRKSGDDTWIEYKEQNGGKVMALYTNGGVAKGLLVGQHHWAFS